MEEVLAVFAASWVAEKEAARFGEKCHRVRVVRGIQERIMPE